MDFLEEDDIVIGEGVRLGSSAANVAQRMGSGIIDYIVTIIVLIVANDLLAPLINSVNGAWQLTLKIMVSVVVLVIAPTVVETLTRGQSLGKLALGLRIVRDDGGPVSVRQAFGRAVLNVLETYATFGILAVTVSLFSVRGKRIGDYLAGTYAMRSRGGGRALAPIVMPAGMEEWARTADIRRLPDGTALNARMFLARASQMHPPARARIGLKIATSIRPYVAPAPPENIHPETFIAAALAARRDREYRQAMASAATAQEESVRLTRLPYGVPESDG